MDANARASVKNVLLNTICSPEDIASHTAAQACAEVAAVELPYNQWPEFIPALMKNVTSPETPDAVKIATLSCLGFTCERIVSLEDAPDIATDISDKMLTTIVDGIHSNRPDAVRLSAANALRNSLAFTKKNMETESERNIIMQAVCEATQSSDAKVRAAAFDCIGNIAYQYYDHLANYMMTLYSLSTTAIEKDEESVAMQAIEFWSTLCEEEMECMNNFHMATSEWNQASFGRNNNRFGGRRR